MNNEQGRLIVFEGGDATGKTTLSEKLFDALVSEHWPVQRFHFPGKDSGTLGELVYRIHHDHSTEFGIPHINPCALQLLHIAAHIDTIESSIKQAITEGAWVILDRFWWSTYVYGLDNGISEKSLNLMIDIEKLTWGSVKPDIVFLVDSPSPLRGDEENSSAWQKRRKHYIDLSSKEGELYKCMKIQPENTIAGTARVLKKILLEIEALVKTQKKENQR